MADLQEYLAILDAEPHNAQALAGLENLISQNGSDGDAAALQALDAARRSHRDRGDLELVAALLDAELKAAKDQARRADLLLEKGRLLSDELLDEDAAVVCFQEVLELRPDDPDAQEVLANIELVRSNWEKFVKKYLDEAQSSMDRALTTQMYLSAAETYQRYKPGAPEIEQYLRKALEVEPKNRRAAQRLERLLRAGGRWADLAAFLEARVDAAAGKEERVQVLLALADIARSRLDDAPRALEMMRKVLAVEPAHPRALQALVDAYSADNNWSALVKVYEGALKVRARTPDQELATVLQVAMIYWKRLDQRDAAEEYFRRVRKAEPAHQAMVDFYREYHRERGEGGKLLQVLQAAAKAEADPQRKAALAVEMASLAESEVGNPEKAIDSWKAILRQEPKNAEARAALKRLYQRTEKWNALLELLKEEIESHPVGDEAGKRARIELLLEVVAVYRDRLNLDVMVINTFNSILALDPEHAGALDALAQKFEQLGRWNDLTSVLSRKAAAPGTPAGEKVQLLRRIASLWSDRSGNHAQAIKPLEDLLALAPGDREAIGKLKEIYARRRQWRALIELMGRELESLPEGQRRNQLAEMAALASDRLGDTRSSIAIWNRVLEDEPTDALALASLASLYEKEKRWPALAEVYHRQREGLRGGQEDPRAAVAILERLGTLYAERLDAPAQAAAVFEEVVQLQPGHTKALRVLRELYAHAGDLDALERLYGSMNAWDDLIEVLYGVADRAADQPRKLEVLRRAARLAEAKIAAPERIARAHERILTVDPQNLESAKALVPLYRKGEKWARLLSTFEVVLGHAKDPRERLALLTEIRKLCEEKIGSKAMAFQWCAAAYELAPGDEALLKELERLGAEADAWEKVAEILERRAGAEGVSDDEKVRLQRELGRIYAARLHKPDPSRSAWEKVLAARPDDDEAMTALEELNVHDGRWQDVLVIYRRRAELESDKTKKIDLLFKIAFIEEERVGDLDAAAKTYQQITKIDKKSARAVRALSKVQGARGDAEGLSSALELELASADEQEQKLGLLLRLGGIYEERLGKREVALERYRSAFELAPMRREVQAALERFMEPGAGEKVEIARLLAPAYEKVDDSARLAKALEILRAAEADEAARMALDRRLIVLYKRLEDPLNAYEAASRVLQAAPDDVENRRETFRLATEVQALDDLAKELEKALAAAEAKGLETRARHELAVELAELLDERLAEPGPAEAAWRRVLELDAADQRAYAALERLLRAQNRWDDLREILERHEQHVLSGDARREILLALCDLFESVLDDPAGATGAYQRVLETDPASMRAYKALERLHEKAERWSELEALLGRESEVAAEGDRTALAFRRAELRAARLADPAGALDLIEEVLAKEPRHEGARELAEELLGQPDHQLRVARLLRPIYQADGLWRDVVRTLIAERKVVSGAHEAVELLARVAALQEDRLADEAAAFATWQEAFTVDAEDARARRELPRLAEKLRRWPDAAAAWEQAIERAPATDLSLRAALCAEVAKFYDGPLADADRAVSAYERLLEVDPGNAEVGRPAAAALERLYEQRERWSQLIDILRRQADWADAPAKRVDYLSRIARIQEARLEQPESAIGTWRELLAEDAENSAALDALERLYAERDEHRELIEILRRRVELTREPAFKRPLYMRVAGLYERELSSPSDAVAVLLEVLDVLPEDAGVLAELARLYRAGERFSDLVEIDERRLALAQGAQERAELRMELGMLLRDQLGRRDEALERFRQILAEDPGHAAARAAVEALLDDVDLRLRAAEVLQPIYEGGAEHEKLVELYALEASALDDARERVIRLKKIAALEEGPLARPDKAFDAVVRAVRLAVAEPEFKELLAQLQRMAFERDRVGDLVELYRELAPDILDADLQRRMFLDVADLARGKLRDVAMARDYYRRVLDSQPDDARALDALERLYRETGEVQELRAILRAKVERPDVPLDARAQALTEIAILCEEKLDEPDEAVLAWEQALELMPADTDAVHSLERLYAARERWVELSELLERRLGFAEDLAEAVELRYRLGELFEKRLSDPDRAVENYTAVLGGDPQHAGAIAALERTLEDAALRLQAAEVLEPLYISRQNWAGLIRITEIRLDAEQDPESRLGLTRRIARLYEEQLEDLEGAFRWYGKVFREDPEDRQPRDQLLRLATILDSWNALANVYQEYLEDEPGDSPAAREVARALADICDRRLDDVERARGAFRRLLALDPTDASAFTQLEAMLTRAQRWFALIEAYEEALEAALEPSRRIDLFGRIARVQEQRLDAADKAIEAWRAVMEIDPDQTGAIDELDRLYQGHKRWHDLGELLQARIDRAASAKIAHALRLRLAELLEGRLDDTVGAIDQYEQVLREDPAHAGAIAALERLVMVEEHRQRIAELLEPIYRQKDWWQKLVVILDARLAYIEDKATRVEILREIAQLHEQRGGNQQLALEALARAWKEEVSDDGVYEELARLAGKLEAWPFLVETLDAGVEGIYDYDLAARLLARIGTIEEEKRGRRPAAIAAWKRVFEVKEDDLGALDALARLYHAERQWQPLVDALKRKAELVSEALERKDLYYRAAELEERALGQPQAAIVTWRQVLSFDEEDDAALNALERLYRDAGEHRALVEILAQKIVLAQDQAEKRRLMFAAAEVWQGPIGDAFEAISLYRAVLDESADDGDALAALDVLYTREKNWADLVETLDRRVQLAADEAVRAELAHRAAGVVDRELSEVEQAIDRYRAILAYAPRHAPTREALEALTLKEESREAACDALEPIYRADYLWAPLAALYERRLESGGDSATRRERFAQLAQIHEEGRRDLNAAAATWARALRENLEDEQVHAELNRLAAARGAWAELSALYEELLDEAMDGDVRRQLSMKAAQIQEEALGNLDRAAELQRRALDAGGDETPALAALDRVLERLGRWAELAEILEREAEAALSADDQAGFLYRLGDVRERQLGDAPGAVNAYRDVLERVPGHQAARAALERLLGSPGERALVIAILEPIYENEGDHARLADLIEHKLTVEESAGERAAQLMQLAELAEEKLGDKVRALDAVGRWLHEDPASEQAAEELGRLAGELGRWEEAAARFTDVLGQSLDETTARELSLRLGRILAGSLRDPARAEAAYRRVLELDPTHGEALVALDGIYRQLGDVAKLVEMLWRRGEAEVDAQKKRACFAEAARLREENLGDDDGAVTGWKEVLDLEESDSEALVRLQAIYERKQAWEPLVEVLELAARHAHDKADELAARRRAAHVLADELGALDRAVDAWTQVLDLTPDDDGAMVELEKVHRRREDWLAVQEVLVRRAGAAGHNREKLEIYRALVALAENERRSPDEAVSYLLQMLDFDNAEASTYAELERLYRAGERWHELVELYDRHADVRGTLGDSEAEIALYAKAADVWEGPLANPSAAAEILEKILRREPRYVPALARLARIYEAEEDWERCGQALEKALAMGPTGRDAADVYFRLGRVAAAQGQTEAAQAHWQRALEHDPAHPEAVVALEQAARERGDWGLVAHLLGRRQQAESDVEQKLALTIELASILKDKLGQAAQAVPYLEQAHAARPEDTAVADALADIYFAAGRLSDAEPIYARLADAAKAQRRAKDVARYRQRLGALREAAGDAAAALKEYEEAYRVDPSSGATLAGLGRIYVAREDWDKAQKIYRSMLLQNIDPSVGVSKADVYLALGLIHQKKGEGPKAKSMFERGLEQEPQHAGLREALASLG